MSVADRHQALRAALVAAAERTIAKAGLPGLRARDLAREAGCAVGAIYGVFPDLDALILAVNARTLEAVDAELRAGHIGEDAAAQLVALADAYCAYAAQHRERWTAVFAHRMPAGRAVPGWYLDLQARLFRHVEAPLSRLRPGIGEADLAQLARSVFSAVHGVVSLGLDEKLAPMPEGSLRGQVRTVMSAIARGLAPPADGG